MKKRPPTIGILNGSQDEQALHVARCVERLGGEALMLDLLDFPKGLQLSEWDGNWSCGSQALEVDAWYVRYFYFMPSADPVADRERESFLTAVLTNGADAITEVNPVSALLQNRDKPYQLHLLRRAGIPLPRTLISNDPQRVREFVDATRDVIYKPVAGGALAQRWTPECLERLSLLSAGPVIFQERIDGENLRVHVLGSSVVSCSVIRSESLDYRSSGFEQERGELSPVQAKLCVDACQATGMHFCALDLIRRRDGELIVLEANPTPFFLVFEQRLEDPIGAQLAAYLVEHAAKAARRRRARVIRSRSSQ